MSCTRRAAHSGSCRPITRRRSTSAGSSKNGYPVTDEETYIAPIYPRGPISDVSILSWIEAHKPRYVIINLGGGVQERLGYYLKSNLSYRPSIICVGAAVAFLTGVQANIPAWADTLMLGWLFRCLHAPSKFIHATGRHCSSRPSWRGIGRSPAASG